MPRSYFTGSSPGRPLGRFDALASGLSPHATLSRNWNKLAGEWHYEVCADIDGGAQFGLEVCDAALVQLEVVLKLGDASGHVGDISHIFPLIVECMHSWHVLDKCMHS